MKIIGILKRIFNRTLDVMGILAGILLIFSVISISVGVASRYLLGRPMAWVVEISEYSIVYITFLIAAWVLKREGHVRMDLVFNRLKPRTQHMMGIITSMISAIVCFILFWYGLKVAWELFQTRYFTPTILAAPKFVIVAIIFIGSLLLFFQFLIKTFDYLSTWRASQNVRKEP